MRAKIQPLPLIRAAMAAVVGLALTASAAENPKPIPTGTLLAYPEVKDPKMIDRALTEGEKQSLEKFLAKQREQLTKAIGGVSTPEEKAAAIEKFSEWVLEMYASKQSAAEIAGITRARIEKMALDRFKEKNSGAKVAEIQCPMVVVEKGDLKVWTTFMIEGDKAPKVVNHNFKSNNPNLVLAAVAKNYLDAIANVRMYTQVQEVVQKDLAALVKASGVTPGKEARSYESVQKGNLPFMTAASTPSPTFAVPVRRTDLVLKDDMVKTAALKIDRVRRMIESLPAPERSSYVMALNADVKKILELKQTIELTRSQLSARMALLARKTLADKKDTIPFYETVGIESVHTDFEPKEEGQSQKYFIAAQIRLLDGSSKGVVLISPEDLGTATMVFRLMYLEFVNEYLAYRPAIQELAEADMKTLVEKYVKPSIPKP